MPGKRSLGIPCRFSQKDSRELSWNLEEANLTKKKEVRHWVQDSGHSLSLLPAPSMSGMLVIHRVTVSILVKFPQTVLPSPIYTSGERRRRHSTTVPMESRSIVPFDGFNWGRVRLGNLDLGFEIRILDWDKTKNKTDFNFRKSVPEVWRLDSIYNRGGFSHVTQSL